MKYLKTFWIIYVSFSFSSLLLPCVDVPFHPEYFFLEELITGEKRIHRDPIYISEIYIDENVKEWSQFLGKGISREDLKKLLYQTDVNELEKIQKDPLAYKRLGKKKETFLTYLLYAKKNENLSHNPNLGLWEDIDSSPARKDPNLIQEGLNLLETTKERFLRERYVFQIVKLYYFHGLYKESIDFYNKHEKELNPNGNMKARSMGYLAGSHFRSKNYGEANALYTKIYLAYPLQREVALTSFHPNEEEDWNKTLEILESPRERILAWFLFGMKFDRPYAIQEIAKIDPNSKYINLLLARALREVNSTVFEDDPDYRNLQSKELKKIQPLEDSFLLKTMKTIASTEERKKDFVWQIASAHLHYLSLDFANGDRYLEAALRLKKKSQLNDKQFHLTALLGKILRIRTWNEQEELAISPHIKYMFSPETGNKQDERMEYPMSWVRKVLAFYLAQKGEVFAAEWIHPGQDVKFYKSLDNIDKMLDYLEDKSKRDLLMFFHDSPFYTKEDLQLLQGIRYTLQEKHQKALSIFEKIPDSYYKNLTLVFQNDPFENNVKDYYNLNYEDKPRQFYHYKSFLRALIELDSKPEIEKTSEDFYKLGNAYYNLSYFGNSGFSANRVYGVREYAGWGYLPENASKEDYPELDTSIALKYFRLAIEKSTEPDFRAKVMFMAAKTEHAEFILQQGSEKAGKDFRAGKYFQELKENLKQTAYYSEILKECTYFLRYDGR